MTSGHDSHSPDKSVGEHTAYWQKRAQEQGKRCVVHCSHNQQDADRETAILANHIGVSLAALYPKKFPAGSQILDFGCGWGRWTRFLADATGAHVTGVDIAPAHIAKADPSSFTSFVLREDPLVPLPFEDHSLDLIFTCTVLQHQVLPDILGYTLEEFERVLKKTGRLLMFEATANLPPKKHIHFRTLDDYQKLLPWARLESGWEYVIRGEEHSIILGERA